MVQRIPGACICFFPRPNIKKYRCRTLPEFVARAAASMPGCCAQGVEVRVVEASDPIVFQARALKDFGVGQLVLVPYSEAGVHDFAGGDKLPAPFWAALEAQEPKHANMRRSTIIMTVETITFAHEGEPPSKRRKKAEEVPVLAVRVPVLVNTKQMVAWTACWA